MLPTTLLEDLNEGLLAFFKVLIDLFQKVVVSRNSQKFDQNFTTGNVFLKIWRNKKCLIIRLS